MGTNHCIGVGFGPLIASDDYSALLLLNDRKVADVDIGSKKNACNYTGRLVMKNLHAMAFSTRNRKHIDFQSVLKEILESI